MQLQQQTLFDGLETEFPEQTESLVYVDRYQDCSHLFVDPETPLDELHSFAESLNLPGSAYKTTGAIPHYRLNKSQRNKALELGAMSCDDAGVDAMTHAWKLPVIGICVTVSADPSVPNTKDVRRTFGFRDLQPGALLKAAVRMQGQLGVTIKVIRVVSVRKEALSKMEHDREYGKREAAREGFPHLTGAEFVDCFCKKYKVVPSTPVTRIEFTYV
ncbi:DUF4031 domain-containing protein [Gimesia fumaroli]|uniref:DUF4031 domain-containing protein n=1 Tax=Gimesia fumaroli TaxID=2527976 RepID=A0A518IGD3_9PLAN|nr:DUF4031 domain-containing protein [Gimesia fumaroli]QDV52148.1 hypothetical protein Enr17x_42080 [Gimesia fumaroli]